MLVPREHGAWAMLYVPILVGIFVGGITLWDVPLLIGITAVYLANYPLILMIKQERNRKAYFNWFLAYSGVGFAFLALVSIKFPSLIFLAIAGVISLIVNIYFVKKKHERHFINDIVGVAALSTGAIAGYLVATGKLDTTAWGVWLLNVLFFSESIFHVKALIRERNNYLFYFFGLVIHLGIPLIIFWVGQTFQIWPVESYIAFIPGILKYLIMTRKKKIYTSVKIGMLEMFNCVVFFMVISSLYQK